MITKPKGTVDIFQGNVEKWVKLEEMIRRVCKLYNYKEIRTPIFEKGELFHRNNETSDMVSKETYDFFDRNDSQMTLRPEGTAGVVRAYIENKMYVDNVVKKLFYMGPIFRYERPQKGRQRQFNQFGIEAFGSNSPILDAETIATAVTLIKALDLKGIKVLINSMGDDESRKQYKDVLVAYFTKYIDHMCEDCKVRIQNNPLRILDCKKDGLKDFMINAPKIKDYLTKESQEHFNQVIEALKTMEIDYEIKDNLVRGLDYYTYTVFEIEVDIKDFGAQNVICGGGRYNNLVSDLNGPNTPAVGLAFGMERLLLALEAEQKVITKEGFNYLYIISLGQKANLKAVGLANECRLGGLSTEIDFFNKNLKAQFNLADKYNSRFIAILGEDELNNNKINVKDTTTQEQITIDIDNLYDYIIGKLNEGKKDCSGCK